MSERIEIIDIFKAILIVSVVICHEFYSLKILVSFLSGFMLPLFFFVSGFFLKPTKTIKDFIFSRNKGILLPYFTLGFISSLFYIPLYSYEKVQTLIISEIFSWQTLWFLPIIYLSNIISFLIIKHFESLCIFFAILFLLLGGFLDYYNVNLWLQLQVVPIGTCLCIVGYYTYNKTSIININKPSKYYLLCLPIYFCIIYYKNYNLELRLNHINPIHIFIVCTTLGCYFVLFLSHAIGKIKYINMLFSYIGRNTLLILAIHMPIFFNMQFYIRPLFESPISYKLIEMFVLFVTSLAFCIFTNKYLYFLIGKKSKLQ